MLEIEAYTPFLFMNDYWYLVALMLSNVCVLNLKLDHLQAYRTYTHLQKL